MITSDNNKKLFDLLNKYNLTNDEKEEFLNIVTSIYSHDEFQRRMTNEFLHHDKITLGEHILEDAIVTYLLSQKYKDNPNFNLVIATKIAMMHDLYTLPWQNNPDAKVDKAINKHGFRHPIEAVINANTWYPEIFSVKEDAEKIIDGIVHHMYPLPVRRFNTSENNDLELKNYENIKNLNIINKEILLNSSNRFKLGPFSLSKSIYKEGIIMSKSDKIVSRSNFKNRDNLNGIIALVTGNNKNLQEEELKRKTNHHR